MFQALYSFLQQDPEGEERREAGSQAGIRHPRWSTEEAGVLLPTQGVRVLVEGL